MTVWAVLVVDADGLQTVYGPFGTDDDAQAVAFAILAADETVADAQALPLIPPAGPGQ